MKLQRSPRLLERLGGIVLLLAPAAPQTAEFEVVSSGSGEEGVPVSPCVTTAGNRPDYVRFANWRGCERPPPARVFRWKRQSDRTLLRRARLLYAW